MMLAFVGGKYSLLVFQLDCRQRLSYHVVRQTLAYVVAVSPHVNSAVKLKRTITIEFDRVKITTTHCAKNFFRCNLCGAETEFFSRQEASELMKILQMQDLSINRANLHFYQTNDEQILICLNSILNGNNPKINKLIS
ncbi:MAG: hypothetical protein H0X15_11805 [Acidobacteria bacterium]|nr:hypothetical protein [Acidobacteriota bacterium]